MGTKADELSIAEKKALLEVVTTLKALSYLTESVCELAKKNPKHVPFRNTVIEFGKNLSAQLNRKKSPWEATVAQEVPSDFQNLQRNLSEEALKTILAKVKGADVKIDLAIGALAEFLRGYSVAGKSPDDELRDALDTLINAYFAEKQLLSKDGKLYTIDKEGKIKQEQTEKDKISQLVNDKKLGIAALLKDKGINAAVEEHPFPEQKPAVIPPEMATEAPKKPIETPTQEPVTQPTAPTSEEMKQS